MVGDFAPDVVLISQGNIEQSCTAFGLTGKVGAPVVSYIPVPHKHAEMGAKLGPLRDVTCACLYGEPDGFITISKTLGQMLETYGAKGRIQIVENGIPLERFGSLPEKSAARAHFGLPEEGFFWGLIGRTEFKQKGQDFALELFLRRVEQFPDEHLVFLGSGPDSGALSREAGVHEQVHVLPWTDNPAPLYRAIDGLLLPSRYEGVPLAMLEALANGVPVASTDRDGMRDWLPKEWRYGYRDTSAALEVMDRVRQAEPSVVSELRERVWSKHSIECFQRDFNQALEQWLIS